MSLLDVEMLENGIRALNFRLTSLEKTVSGLSGIAKMEQDKSEIRKSLISTMFSDRLSPICDKIARIESELALKQRSMDFKAPIPPVEVPTDLRLIPGKRGKKANRTDEVVQRRWEIWKMQFEAGIPLNAIARAWNCDHGTICYAKKKNWIAGNARRSLRKSK